MLTFILFMILFIFELRKKLSKIDKFKDGLFYFLFLLKFFFIIIMIKYKIYIKLVSFFS